MGIVYTNTTDDLWKALRELQGKSSRNIMARGTLVCRSMGAFHTRGFFFSLLLFFSPGKKKKVSVFKSGRTRVVEQILIRARVGKACVHWTLSLMIDINTKHFYTCVAQRMPEWARKLAVASFASSSLRCLPWASYRKHLLVSAPIWGREEEIPNHPRQREVLSAGLGEGRRSLSLTCLTKTFVRHIWVAAARLLLLCFSPAAAAPDVSLLAATSWVSCVASGLDFAWCLLLLPLSRLMTGFIRV